MNQVIAPGRRHDMPAADGSSTRRIYVYPQMVLQSTHGYAAGSQHACSLGSCAMRQTDGMTDGRIVV